MPGEGKFLRNKRVRMYHKGIIYPFLFLDVPLGSTLFYRNQQSCNRSAVPLRSSSPACCSQISKESLWREFPILKRTITCPTPFPTTSSRVSKSHLSFIFQYPHLQHSIISLHSLTKSNLNTFCVVSPQNTSCKTQNWVKLGGFHNCWL